MLAGGHFHLAPRAAKTTQISPAGTGRLCCAVLLEPRARRVRDDKDRKIAHLEQKLQRKHEVLSELMEEHVKLKKATVRKRAR